MMKAIFLGFLAAGAIVLPALAGDVPDFLKNRTYATDVSQCGGTEADTDALQLGEYGVFGTEFSCQFLGFDHDMDPESRQIYVSVATANCGDDSGINRPDMITLVNNFEQGEIEVQSQNEYNLSEALVAIAQSTGQKIPENGQSFVSRTYKLCK